jgi:hypothetical protein
MFSVRELGLGSAETQVDKIIRVFLEIGEAVAARWIQMPEGILILQMVPENPSSGAIYFYDRARQEFYLFSFEGADDTLTVEEFTALVEEYSLLRYAEDPNLLQAHFQPVAAA